MFSKRINLFKLLGFQVRIDLSWIIIAVLVAWSLSEGLFPFQVQGLSTRTYWIMGIVGALGLFLSIIIHEFSHSLVARKYGMRMKGITLFIFGGMAEMSEEPPSPKAEFMMAAVGPVSSVIIAGVFYAVYAAGATGGIPRPVNGVVRYLAYINALLAAFNLLPAFPLAGLRPLRRGRDRPAPGAPLDLPRRHPVLPLRLPPLQRCGARRGSRRGRPDHPAAGGHSRGALHRAHRVRPFVTIDLARHFGPGGTFERSLAGWRVRPQQLEFAQAVLEAIEILKANQQYGHPDIDGPEAMRRVAACETPGW